MTPRLGLGVGCYLCLGSKVYTMINESMYITVDGFIYCLHMFTYNHVPIHFVYVYVCDIYQMRRCCLKVV